MKYYLYISDSKVDMLLPQIPRQAKQKIATELKIDIKIFGASRKTERTTEEDRISRLQAVAEYISNNEDVGTPDQPAEYFSGTLPMRWGPFGLEEQGNSRADDSPIVYFSGSTEQTLVGLGGSAKHVIGNTGGSNPHDWGGSSGPVLLQLLMNVTGTKVQHLESHFRINVDRFDNLHILGLRMEATFGMMEGPEQRLEFLAKRILAGERPVVPQGEKPFVTLGTPLYVAMAE